MMLARLVRALTAFAAVVAVTFVLLAVFRDSVFDYYMNDLDSLVKAGGDADTMQQDVIRPCTKLILSQSGFSQNVKFMTSSHDDIDFYVDMCAKMTVNRLHKQPEFEKPETVKAVCGPSSEPFLQKLCQRSGLSI